jgi:iron complex outermembrane receptor protein
MLPLFGRFSMVARRALVRYCIGIAPAQGANVQQPRRTMKHTITTATLFGSLLSAALASAQTVEDIQALDGVIVTGTRQTGLKAADSPAPIQILDAGMLERSGKAGLIEALVQNVPSFTADAKGGDASALTLSARLRGMSPNHTLVLVNGKRRHGTSNLNVSAGPYQGGAAADLGLIPVSAISRIEVLQDGAAAQYGSDAIAGVINIILKDNPQGGSLGLEAGGYGDGGGKTGNLAANIGLQPFAGAVLNLSAETRYHGHSDRSDLDARFVPPQLTAANANVKNVPGYPYVNHTFGDARVRQDLVAANATLALGGGAQAYGFATFGDKRAEAIQNYRGPGTAPTVFPLGFSPVEIHEEKDGALTLGVRGALGERWNYDLSASYGQDKADVLLDESINAQLLRETGRTPTSFYEGYLKARQASTTLDLSRDIDVGWAGPLNLSVGLEHRVDGYSIGAGDTASSYRGGAAAFPGYSASDAGSHARHNTSAYVDVAGTPVPGLRFDAAVRAERFSDFGSAVVGKLTGRYDLGPGLGLRATVSNGFRAPTLAEDYYSATAVSPTTASVILPSASPAARLLGVPALTAEKSRNLSTGIIARPSAKLSASLDVYVIEVRDRILQSGTLNGVFNGAVVSQVVNNAIAANGNIIPAGVTSSGVALYSNAADTRNTGADLVVGYSADYGGWGTVDWSGAANVSRARVIDVKPVPAVLGSQRVFDATARSFLENAAPTYRVNLGALWRSGGWTVNVRENLFGASSYESTLDNVKYFHNRNRSKALTDLEISRQFGGGWSVSVGANNLFNVYPDELNADYRAVLDKAGRQNVARYASSSPVGINGAYYYGKATLRF